MKILHPNKNAYLSLNALDEYFINGYYSIIDKKEQEKLNYFLRSFEDYRTINKLKPIPKHLYSNLPFSIHSKEWKVRQHDIKIINRIINNRKELKILDVGCYNNWLCNYLAKKGHEITGINIFTDEVDGLKTKKYYSSDFLLLQMKPDDLYRIRYKFDIIIFNRNWAYFENHFKTINDAKQLLEDQGQLFFSGLHFYKKIESVQSELKRLSNTFKKNYGIPLLYTNTKGYLSNDDKYILSNHSIKLKPYYPIKKAVPFKFNKLPHANYGIFKKE